MTRKVESMQRMFFDNNLDRGSTDNKSKVLNLLVSTYKYRRKPTPDKRGLIKASFFNPKNSLQSATLEELVRYMGQGQSVNPAYLLKVGPEKGPRKSSKFISQQLWLVDIDNYDDFDKKGNRRLPDEKLCINNIFRLCREYQCEPFFIAESFSSTKSVPRFRVGFISAEPVTDRVTRDRVAEAFYFMFQSEFRYTDEKTREIAQTFYGTSSNRIKHINYDAVFDVQALLKHYSVLSELYREELQAKSKYHDIKASLHNPSNKYNKTQNAYITWVMNDDVQAEYKSHHIKDIPRSPSNKHTKTQNAYITWVMKSTETDARFIESNRLPWNHLTKYRIGEDFCCEFHDDEHPSAAIIEVDRGHGTEYFYCCQAESCEHRMLSQVEYLHLTQRITKTAALKKVLAYRPEVQPQKELLDKLDTVRDDYPEESSTWGFAKTNGDEILKVFVRTAIENSIVVGDCVRFPLAESGICEELKNRNISGCSAEPVHRKIKDFESYGLLIRGVSDKEMEGIPGALDYFVEEQENQGRARHCKWWEMPLTPDLGEHIHAATKRLREDRQRGKRGAITREAVLLAKGREEADKLFNQDTDREVSDVTLEFTHVVKLVTRRLLDTYGWTSERRILDFLHGNWTYEGFNCFMGEERKKAKLRAVWPRLLQDLDAEYRVINQGLRDRFAIPRTVNQGTKILYRRIERVQTHKRYPEQEQTVNVPRPVECTENIVREFQGTLRDRIRLHAHHMTGKLHRLQTMMRLKAFEDAKWERMEQKRRKVRDLVIPHDGEEFDAVLRATCC